jgi:mRNA interferase RelE/StbE
MRFHIRLTTSARDDLEKSDRQVRERIVRKLLFFEQQTNPLRHAKKLKEHWIGTYRFRIGDYRALFDVDEKGNLTILLILAVRHRKDSYR